ncbi:NAD(P)H-dependent glycerol-3-phosphate dehydrogenase [Aureibacillus halotolerans]|uniref:Glycerol-3-phosphate dehydrogenase [NAD(P)+] n=1 Tax=Aureibacillus halotolerans TaxID=1508390 RepID=A0A4R6U5P2_9BACI|nr:NAD(P)H-dependent glycerol-3-phosphate dehydrogenase [Aureibacillus halotolerans]TDQ41541.1 glycerol 3-phosphate dehydrogenase (NAD(P)+) [Aureibacillus halotolerans]
MARVTVIGAGSWGTALAMVLADNEHDVYLWTHRENQAEEINTEHKNEAYLKGVTLPETLNAGTSCQDAMDGAAYVLLAIPTKALRDVLSQLIPFMKQPMYFVHAIKGIEPSTFLRPSEIIKHLVPEALRLDVSVLSGPSHAEEVSLRKPTTVAVASSNANTSNQVQDLFMNTHFRVYTNPDLIGVEMGGALKNIIALGAGISDGLGYGDNAKAALMTRGLAEMTRLGSEMGGNPLTFAGLTGIGDLIATCTSQHSRNWRAGYLLGTGHSQEETLQQMNMVVEGVRTTKAVHQIAKEKKIAMPITEAIFDVWFNGKMAKTAVDELMNRTRTSEMDSMDELFGERPF